MHALLGVENEVFVLLPQWSSCDSVEIFLKAKAKEHLPPTPGICRTLLRFGGVLWLSDGFQL